LGYKSGYVHHTTGSPSKHLPRFAPLPLTEPTMNNRCVVEQEHLS
jgi:hypothetical protein